MPKISEQLRAERQRHILTSAWGCFSRNGFHATSMDDVIAATGMSSSAVYRYFRGKDDLITAAADEALVLTRDLFARLLYMVPGPTPAQTVAAIVDELHTRSSRQDYDLTRIAIQAWAEALRSPALQGRTRTFYLDARAHLAELARRWRADGHLPQTADPEAVATALFIVMPGLLVTHHLVDDVSAEALIGGWVGLAGVDWTVPQEQLPKGRPMP